MEVGRNREKQRSDGYEGDAIDFESTGGIRLSCSIWDTNEVVRVQLFEFRPKVSLKLLGGPCLLPGSGGYQSACG